MTINHTLNTPQDSHPNAALSLRNLTKNYSGHLAVNNLSLDIPRGSFYGIVGPNGAGKTTALMMGTGMLEPSQGNAWVCGHPLWEKAPQEEILAAKQSYGLLADGLPVFDRLSGKEYLEYLGYLRGLGTKEIQTRSEELLLALDLQDAGKKYIVDYSAGMTKKILLAAALLHSPEVLILDEPLEAVDPVSAQIIRQILHQFVSAGGTVVISSHVMELVENICSHVAIINKGTVHAAGTLDEVRNGMSLTDRFVNAVGGKTLADGSLGWLNHAQPAAEHEE
ncbi:ABC transporter ATP-binding protein [Corynebacterium sp. sy017]|uniref:ABC transporter ATP-binding protein n=1 Tax=unclassified Corynebacterium TaxID=2624378 RepID=UPI0011869199|nr:MULTISPECIES: ABC transporter ATP-binding protein [unclassified Corynebacterium]MBP3089464.1 ABC transporter ATP-binding protein [Corynebacterium sp. sy017]QDZ43638.1 ABC transporter ATP-binding protein [Corynebacterium sp. sy039]TSD90855.1 ABC transporter ATP-binding protein [Corynebacterium sp. SY003]